MRVLPAASFGNLVNFVYFVLHNFHVSRVLAVLEVFAQTRTIGAYAIQTFAGNLNAMASIAGPNITSPIAPVTCFLSITTLALPFVWITRVQAFTPEFQLLHLVISKISREEIVRRLAPIIGG